MEAKEQNLKSTNEVGGKADLKRLDLNPKTCFWASFTICKPLIRTFFQPCAEHTLAIDWP
jgi:hypothetical protein